MPTETMNRMVEKEVIITATLKKHNYYDDSHLSWSIQCKISVAAAAGKRNS